MIAQAADSLQSQMPSARQRVQSARDSMSGLKGAADQAYDSAHQESLWSFLEPALEAAGSALSEAYLHVDIVPFIKKGVQLRNDIKAGRKFNAAEDVFDIADKADDGKLRESLGDYNIPIGDDKVSAADYLSSNMPDTLDAFTDVKDALTTPGVIQAFAQQAAGLGVAGLNNSTDIDKLVQQSGLSEGEVKQTLGIVEQNAVDQAMEEMGQDFRAAVRDQFPDIAITTWNTVDWKKLEDLVQKKWGIPCNGDPAQAAVIIVAQLKAGGHTADVQTLKAHLLGARTDLRQALSRGGKDVGELPDASNPASNDSTALPPLEVPLPAEVLTAINNYEAGIGKAQGAADYVTSPECKAQAEQIGTQAQSRDQFDQGFNQFIDQLTTRLNDADAALDHAQRVSLPAIANSLNEKKIDSYVSDLEAQASKFNLDAAINDVKAQGQFLNAAIQDGAEAEKQTKIEQIGQQILQAKIDDQKQHVIPEQQDLADEASLRAKGAALAQQRALRDRDLYLSELPGKRSQEALDASANWYMDSINLDLVRAWKLITLYEDNAYAELPRWSRNNPDQPYPTLPPPGFGLHNATELQGLVSTYLAAKAGFTKAARLRGRPWFASLSTAKLRAYHPDNEIDGLLQDVLETYDNNPPLKLGRDDFERLTSPAGISFEIQPADAALGPGPPGTPQKSPTQSRFVLRWKTADDGPTFRHRILGVVFDVDSSFLKHRRDAVFYLRQQNDGWLLMPGDDAHPSQKVIVGPELGTLRELQAPRGRRNIIYREPLDTLPLFGTYTLRLQTSTPLKPTEHFSVKVHFIAIGSTD